MSPLTDDDREKGQIALAHGPRCGRPRDGDGEPCRAPVANEGDVCHLHDEEKRARRVERAIKHKTLRDLIKTFNDDPDPLNLFEEIATLRALSVNFINEHEERTEALLAWYSALKGIPRLPTGLALALERAADLWRKRQVETDDWTPDLERQFAEFGQVLKIMRGEAVVPEKPRKVSDLADATKIIDSLGRMVERIDGIRRRNTISEAELARLLSMMSRVVSVLVTDETTKAKIQEAWLGIVTR